MLRPVLYLLLAVACQLFCHEGLAFSAPGGWAATYGGANCDEAHSIQQTSEGGYIVCGMTKPFGAGGCYDAWVLKLRADGTVGWQKTYGGIDGDMAHSIQQTRDGGYIVAGGTESFGAGKADAWVLKLGADGVVEWQKAYGGARKEEGYYIQQTGEGGYVMVGMTASFSDNKWGTAWVLKLRSDGTVEWQKAYGGNGNYYADYIQQTRDGGYIVAGWTSASFGAGMDDFWVLKLGVDGSVEWQKTYGGRSSEQASCIRQTAEGGYIVTGRTGSYGAGPYDIWVLKLQADGSLHWAKTYGGIHSDEAHFIGETTEGGYVVAGWTSYEFPPFGESRQDIKMRFWVLKLRREGSVEWQKTYERGQFDILSSAQQTGDGGYILAGSTIPFGEHRGRDILIFKLRADGSINPSCGFVKETNIYGNDSYAIVKDTTVGLLDTNANPQDSSAIVQDTDATVDLFCPPTPRP